MAAPLKALYNRPYLTRLAQACAAVHPPFDEQAFLRSVFDRDWPARELKARMQHITCCLHEHLQLPYREALPVLMQACPPFGGYHGMFFPDYVEQFGLGHWRESMRALAHFTVFSSSEFAVRPFIRQDPARMMRQMLQWSRHRDPAVRRLASEGCRPRLPWASQLPALVADPAPILPVLEQLKADPSLYVRKSVANNLNDIAKDHPACVLLLAARWRGQHPHTDWIIKRGCRTLLKAGDAAVLDLLGYGDAAHVRVERFSAPRRLALGESLPMQLALSSARGDLGHLRIEYGVDFPRQRGQTRTKVFQWAEQVFPAETVRLARRQPFEPLSTRVLYPGRYRISLRLNGCERAELFFDLV